MVRDYLGDPYDPSLVGSAAYGHNAGGALSLGLGWSFVEMLLMMIILRPWTYRRSWKRAALAVALAVPWCFASMVFTMHGGGVVALHFLWVLALSAIAMVLAIAGAIAAAVGGEIDEEVLRDGACSASD